MEEKRLALLVAGDAYQDGDLSKLMCPSRDMESLARVLADPAIGRFKVKPVLNQPLSTVMQEVERFCMDSHRDDLLLLYFSCHGIKDADGRLYFACTDTNRKLLRSTALPARWVNELIQDSRARRQVLLLDCCYSGAFARGMMAKADRSAIDLKSFGEQGMGRVVLTASSELQYSFEGDTLKEQGQAVESIFTGSLVRGLESGEPDVDGKGFITLDELYDYVYKEVRDKQPEQRPQKWDFGVQGQITIAYNLNPIIKPKPLPPELLESIKDTNPINLHSVVLHLIDYSDGDDAGLALSASTELKSIENDERIMVKTRTLIQEALIRFSEKQDEASIEEVGKAVELSHEERSSEKPVSIDGTVPSTGHEYVQPHEGGGVSPIPEGQSTQPLSTDLAEKSPVGESRSKLSYWSALGWNMCFGFGLFHVDRSLPRKWVYPVCAISSILAWIVMLDNVSSLGRNEVLTFVLIMVAVIGLAGWLVSFVDIALICKARAAREDIPSYTDAIIWNLFLGSGLVRVAPDLKRGWMYVSFASWFMADIVLGTAGAVYPILRSALSRNDLVGFVFLGALGLPLWLLSFVDVVFMLRKKT